MISEELIRKVTGQQQNERVYKVDLSNRLLTRISSLKPFSKIRYLGLDFNNIRSIENLECLNDLRELHLQFNEIERISGLDSNRMLTVLTLTGNRIQKIENLGQLSRLETLVVDRNLIEKMTGLETLNDLKHLSLSDNKLAAITSLPAFSKLETLIADRNKIRKIPGNVFGEGNRLLKLSLAENQIEDIGFMKQLKMLEELNLSGNKISNLDMPPLRNLEYLNVSGNKIERLPMIANLFPDLSVFLFSNNQIQSEYEIIQALADAEMLIEVDFAGNPMETPDFAQTLHHVYSFDRINGKNYNKAGTRYLQMAQNINKHLKDDEFKQIENNQDIRKIIMSGFYNEEIETEMTGVKPERPSSPNRTTNKLNFDEIEKSYQLILQNNKRMQELRNKCLHIFKENNIIIEAAALKQELSTPETTGESKTMITQVKNLGDRNQHMTAIMELTSKAEQNLNKWKQLKNKEKNFNIRVRAQGSLRKSGSNFREGSLPKIPDKQKSELMKTQLNPPRWNNDPNLMKTMQARPFSAKKKDK